MVRFVLLLLSLSVPFWIVGAIRPIELLPSLPISALQATCPLLAALLLVLSEDGGAGVAALLKRSADFRRIRSTAWDLPALFIRPAVTIVSYALMRALRAPLPDPRFPVGSVPAMAVGFLLLAWTEEVGWSGYATDRMEQRWSAILTGLVLGVAWAAWHVVPLVQARREPAWIAWWSLGTVGSRVIIVWLYNNAGRSIVAAALYHAVSNLCWQLFPNAGSHYDPRFTGPLTALTAVAVTVVWEPRTPAAGRTTRATDR